MKYLILFNRKFPFETGETFLENEIEEISKYFDKFLIYPSNIKFGDKKTRIIKSKNVETRIVEKKDFKTRKYQYLLKSIKYLPKAWKIHGIKNKITEAYFLAAANSQAKKIIKDLEKIDFKKGDKVYLYSYWLYINAKVACIIKKHLESKGVDVVAFSRAHAFDIYEDKRKGGFLPQRQELLRDLDAIYPCSDNGTKYLAKKYPKFKNKIKTSYLGTYDHGVKKYKKHDCFNIVSCSRMALIKRVYLIAESLEKLKDSGLKLSWVHIGDGETYDEVKKIIDEKLGWMDARLLGRKKNSEVYNYYLNNDVDLFINTSSTEGLPVTIMEAISFGIPVIATDVGGTSEIVIDAKNGYLLPENFETEKLRKLIARVVKMNKVNYEKLRKQSREKWEEKYDAVKNYSIFANNILTIEEANDEN